MSIIFSDFIMSQEDKLRSGRAKIQTYISQLSSPNWITRCSDGPCYPLGALLLRVAKIGSICFIM